MKPVPSNSQLRSEIRSVQSQLKTAIQNHQTIVFKLKDRPVSIKLRVQMCNIQRHIVSLGEKQKKLLTQLRKELEANGINIEQKPSLKVLQNLVPNPMNRMASPKPIHIKKDSSIKTECVESEVPPPVKPEVVPHASRRKSKLVPILDEPCKNGLSVSSSSSHKENTPSSTPSSSPTHAASTNKSSKSSINTSSKRDSMPPSSASEESQDAYIHFPADPELRKKLQFMTALSLVTREVLAELQNRRTERKRRSTANPQFLYGNSSDMKRKKSVYLSNSAPAVVPLVNTLNLFNDRVKLPPSLACFACSSSDGLLSQCASCDKGFHWLCLFDASTVAPSGGALKCKVCQEDDVLKKSDRV